MTAKDARKRSCDFYCREIGKSADRGLREKCLRIPLAEKADVIAYLIEGGFTVQNFEGKEIIKVTW